VAVNCFDGCPCCYRRDGFTSGGCTYCSARTYCACGAIVSCSCGYAIEAHSCPCVIVTGTVTAVGTVEPILPLPAAEVWLP
jgi:hypothetical protein